MMGRTQFVIVAYHCADCADMAADSHVCRCCRCRRRCCLVFWSHHCRSPKRRRCLQMSCWSLHMQPPKHFIHWIGSSSETMGSLGMLLRTRRPAIITATNRLWPTCLPQVTNASLSYFVILCHAYSDRSPIRMLPCATDSHAAAPLAVHAGPSRYGECGLTAPRVGGQRTWCCRRLPALRSPRSTRLPSQHHKDTC